MTLLRRVDRGEPLNVAVAPATVVRLSVVRTQNGIVRTGRQQQNERQQSSCKPGEGASSGEEERVHGNLAILSYLDQF